MSVSYWSWTNSNGAATSAQTQKAYEAITNKGRLTDFSYLVWNDIIDKIIEVRQQYNAEMGDWRTVESLEEHGETVRWYDVDSVDEVYMTDNDKYMTAKRFLSTCSNITVIYNGLTDSNRLTIPTSRVYSGSKIYGSYFTEYLTDRINDTIDLL